MFPTLWKKIDSKLDGKTIFSCRAVFNEISHQRDDLFDWVKVRKQIFEQPSGDHTMQMQQVMHHLSTFAAAGGSPNEADPWVISHAMIGDAIIVTDEESANTRSTKPPKLPNACDHLGVKWMAALDFLHAIGICV